MKKYQKNSEDPFRGGEKTELTEMLLRRERRAEEIALFLEKGETVLSFKLNIPGPVKTGEGIFLLFKEGQERIRSGCGASGARIVSEREEDLKTGPEALFLVEGADARELKRIMIELEEEGVGRLYDIDVLTKRGGISREELGYPRRKCFLCENDAKLCARSRTHSVEELLSRIREMILK